MIQAIVTDIEGTTTSLSFVKDILFPYARINLPAYVREHAHEPQVRAQLDAVRAALGTPADDEAVITTLLQWIAEDKKATPLKALQGLVWEKGYADGDFHGHIYADAYEQLRAWHAQGLRLYVYSSGSVYAQKLLYGHTRYGDLTPLFSGYFDTRIGAKTDSAAYHAIVREIGLPAEALLFLSDIEAELDAARAAGMQTCCLVREGIIDSHGRHHQVQSFTDINLGDTSPQDTGITQQ
ncbi:MAG: acireductone synthase [Gammaproteobacteria bacterium]